MNLRCWRWIAAVGATVSLAACAPGTTPGDNQAYNQGILAGRAAKDAAFRSTAKDSFSPIPVGERASFQGLTYFPINPVYHVPALLTLVPTSPPVIFELQTTGPEKRRRTQEVGTLGFTLQGTKYRLTAFADEGAPLDRLFVPFNDLTNGEETYRGGRYIDLNRTPTGLYDLDFNVAYHPYCVYNFTYDCPVPPSENRLPVAIRAGERLGPSAAHTP